MKKIILIIVLVAAGFAAAYFLPKTSRVGEKFERQIIAAGEYDEAARQIARQINDLSPTPPAGEPWTVSEVEFVPTEPYAYATFHDTRNIFRILLETGQNSRFRSVAAFEPDESGWKLTGGEDLAKGELTVKITVNNQ